MKHKKIRFEEGSGNVFADLGLKDSDAAYPPYAEYQTRTTRMIPIFVAEPVS